MNENQIRVYPKGFERISIYHDIKRLYLERIDKIQGIIELSIEDKLAKEENIVTKFTIDYSRLTFQR